MIDANTVIVRNSRVAYHQLGHGQGGVLLHLDTGAYHGLNDIGVLIWQLLDEQRTFDQLVGLLRGRVDDAPPTLAGEISQYVTDLSTRDLVRLSTAAGPS